MFLEGDVEVVVDVSLLLALLGQLNAGGAEFAALLEGGKAPRLLQLLLARLPLRLGGGGRVSSLVLSRHLYKNVNQL